MRDARAEITGGINRVAGRPAERESDGPDEQRHRHRAQGAEIHGHRGPRHVALECALHGKDAKHQHERSDHLTNKIRRRTPDRRSRAEDRPFELSIGGLAPMRQVGDPDDDRTEKCPQNLREAVTRHLCPRENSGYRQTDGNRRVQMGAAHPRDGRDGQKNGQRPPGSDHNPSAALPLGAGQKDIRHHTVAENNQQRGADEFAEQGGHNLTLSHGGVLSSPPVPDLMPARKTEEAATMPVEDTIAAISTPPGEGAIALVRISGPDAPAIAKRVFRGGRITPRRAVFGRVVDTAGAIDEVVLTYFAAPASYTGEDVVEITGHGGVVVSARVLQTVLAAGARAAGPGEFTQRAFLNRRLDLTQAEAVMDLIRARTPLAARAAAEQLAGRIGNEITALREVLLDIVAHVEAYIDFPDEDIDPDTGATMRARLNETRQRITRLLATADEGRILREGVRLAICGRPNAGKSSLLNRLLGQERAIVSPAPGTTRDTIEEGLNLRGIPFRVIDTAGLRETPDAIEREGVRRARTAIEEADIVLRLVDATDAGALADPPAAADEIVVLNKVDLAPAPTGTALAISCTTGAGFEALIDALVARVRRSPIEAWDSAAAINARHQACLQRAADGIAAALTQFDAGATPEFVALDLRAALDAVGEVVGVVDTDTILGRIFGSFCIGK